MFNRSQFRSVIITFLRRTGLRYGRLETVSNNVQDNDTITPAGYMRYVISRHVSYRGSDSAKPGLCNKTRREKVNAAPR